MKDLKDMTAAEFVAELADATSISMNQCNNCGHQQRKNKSEGFCNECGTQFVIFHNRKLRTRCTSAPDRLKVGSAAAIIAELAARCAQWGFKLEQLPHGPVWVINKDMLCNHGDFYECYLFAAEFYALLGYLLSKEVKP